MKPAEVLDAVIRRRRTIKIRSDEPLPEDSMGALAETLCATAGWAPFHRAAADIHRSSDLPSIVPFRFHILDAPACRALRLRLVDQPGAAGVVKLLAAAGAMIQATWLPNPSQTDQYFEPSLDNMEHIAAASAAVQNILLAATARGIENYWSSGGILRAREVFDWLEIPTTQILIGSIFLFPAGVEGTEVKTSRTRDQRGDVGDWTRHVQPPLDRPLPLIEVFVGKKNPAKAPK